MNGGSQRHNGAAIRRSRRRNTFFEHQLNAWLTEEQWTCIVNKFKQSFEGMGWKSDTLPTL